MDAFDVMMVVLRFNERINARDLERLVRMMAPDHFFIDSEGERDDDMEKGWRGFFASFPDYSARVRDGLVSEWRVYKDTPENRRILGLE